MKSRRKPAFLFARISSFGSEGLIRRIGRRDVVLIQLSLALFFLFLFLLLFLGEIFLTLLVLIIGLGQQSFLIKGWIVLGKWDLRFFHDKHTTRS